MMLLLMKMLMSWDQTSSVLFLWSSIQRESKNNSCRPAACWKLPKKETAGIACMPHESFCLPLRLSCCLREYTHGWEERVGNSTNKISLSPLRLLFFWQFFLLSFTCHLKIKRGNGRDPKIFCKMVKLWLKLTGDWSIGVCMEEKFRE